LIPKLLEWADVALPKVWSFLTIHLIPKLTELASVTLEALKQAIDMQIKSWQWLLDKITELWSWISEIFIPWVKETFIPDALEAIREVVDKITEAFEKAIEAIKKFLDKLADLIKKAKEAADAMNPFTGGSPSPLELGLRGAAAAMRQLSAVEMPRLAATMYPMPAYAPATAAGGSSTTHNVTVPITANIYSAMDAEEFQIRVERAVVRATRRYG
jgi:hypothetical protein